MPRRAERLSACGTSGYEELLDALADPTHGEHENFLRWVGGSFDPSEFDLVAVNIGLQHLRCARAGGHRE